MMESQYHFSIRDQIVEQIECYIIENALKAGDKLPSERSLCKMWGCNQMTLRAALKRLSSEGKIRSVQGLGNFVADEKMERYLQDLYSFSDFVENQNKTLENKVHGLRKIECTKSLAGKLQLSEGQEVMELIRVRKVDSIPVLVEYAYVSLSRYPGLLDFDFEKQSLYEVLKESYGTIVTCGEEEIGITKASYEEAELLEIEEGSSLFLVKQTSYDQNKNAVEYVSSVARADKMRFATVLRKQA